MHEKFEDLFKGEGINVSKDAQSIHKSTVSAFKQASNLYTLRDAIREESLDYIFDGDYINKTKYFRILLKEWDYVLKVGGNLIIAVHPNSILDRKNLLIEVELILRHTIDSPKFISHNGQEYIVAKKIKSCINPHDKISRWTFGILANGKRDEWVEQQIKSIRAENIPEYEILICGAYNGPKGHDVKVIEFNHHESRGWITAKKNLLCEQAKYDNLFITHDRIVLKAGWYEGFKKFGNLFDAVSCKMMFKDIRSYDWMTVKYPYYSEKSYWQRGGYLEYDDWDKWVVINGAVIMLKKSVWQNVKWDDSLFWAEYEDNKLSHDMTLKGYVLRFNLYSEVETLQSKSEESNLIFNKNIKKLGSRRGRFALRLTNLIMQPIFIIHHISRRVRGKDPYDLLKTDRAYDYWGKIYLPISKAYNSIFRRK